jgi:hypothetical protein
MQTSLAIRPGLLQSEVMIPSRHDELGIFALIIDDPLGSSSYRHLLSKDSPKFLVVKYANPRERMLLA